MPHLSGAAFEVSYYFLCSSRSAEDVAENATHSAVAVVVASISVAGILPVAFVIATYKTLAKSLRRGIAVVVRPLWVKALPALRITGAGIHTSLVSLVDRHLGAVVIAAIVAVVTIVAVVAILPVIVNAAVVIDAAVANTALFVRLPLSPFGAFASPIAVSIPAINITALAARIAIISIVAILGLCCRAR